jgi:hypothetical protein
MNSYKGHRSGSYFKNLELFKKDKDSFLYRYLTGWDPKNICHAHAEGFSK